ncbi:CDP-alcohol phosphatidyltransferase family protein [Roseomonas sp. GC11]|uniref:CDP-alcohol phosphatidyltransferase family protein n=1 Tax=Roseomonas sp. GC11 TaxID=2950546 RepID=UPI00210ACDA6|nr:CDP-alcohol phosphatidyltransferase family protein [Roseomonas sp. GC11]MCQ4163051.1 CDP-alcohol phosphatidyltransferase family protein [Roseomonas sp. GC11]
MPGAAEPPPPEGTPPGQAEGQAGGQALGALTLPNAITLARLFAVPATLWLILHGRLDIAFFVFAGAGLSDALDGWLARRMGSQSSLGALLDPLADKALLVCTYLGLAWAGVLPDWLALLVVFRDVLILGGVALLAFTGAPPRIQPLRISKANTVAQILLAALALLLAGFGLRAPLLMDGLVVLATGTTLASGLAYLLPRLAGEGR